MSLKKDSPKWKAIFLAIDIVLLIVAAAILGYCGYLIYRVSNISDARLLDADIRSRTQQIEQLETKISEKTQEAARLEEQGLAALADAQTVVAAAQEACDAVMPEHTGLRTRVDEFENAPALQEQKKEDIARLRTEYGQTIRKLEDMILAGESDYRICYLTFDDGPSYLTPNFLDKIDGLDIYVTFFTIGVQMGDNADYLRNSLLRREALGGHAIANHTYTHSIYGSLYKSLDNFINAVKKQDELVYSATGMHTDLLRFPAGSYYCPFRKSAIAELDEMGYGWIDWIGNAYDSGNTNYTSGQVAGNVIWQARQDKVTVILMHDWRSETLGALETIVKTLKEENYLFLPLFKESSTVGTASPRWD